MELKTLSVAIATTLTSTGVFALSEPVSQVTEQHAHSAHTHGVESNRVEYQPTATLPIQPSKATRVQSLESLMSRALLVIWKHWLPKAVTN